MLCIMAVLARVVEYCVPELSFRNYHSGTIIVSRNYRVPELSLGSSIMLTNIDAAVLEKYHFEIFKLLHRRLPHDVKSWSYKFEKILKALGEYARVANAREYQMIMKALEQKREW